MPGTWVVLIEAAGDPANGAMDRRSLERLRDALGSGTSAGALHSADRYALQVTTAGPNPVEALYGVLRRWANAVRVLQLPAWEIVRTEVLTPDELERDFQDHGHDAGAVRDASPRPVPGDLGPGDPGPIDDDIGRELVRRAFSDPLTGLQTREAIEHRVERALGRSNPDVAVVCLGIDTFQRLNDRSGHVMGDQVLVAVAGRLASRLRPGDDLARLGADEFAVLLDNRAESAAVTVADRLLDAVRSPLGVEGHDFAMSASAGIASSRPGEGPRDLLDNAAAAMNVARRSGGNRHVLFGPAMPDVRAHTGGDVGHPWVSTTDTQGEQT